MGLEKWRKDTEGSRCWYLGQGKSPTLGIRKIMLAPASPRWAFGEDCFSCIEDGWVRSMRCMGMDAESLGRNIARAYDASGAKDKADEA